MEMRLISASRDFAKEPKNKTDYGPIYLYKNKARSLLEQSVQNWLWGRRNSSLLSACGLKDFICCC
jgi:hypothetical protein